MRARRTIVGGKDHFRDPVQQVVLLHREKLQFVGLYVRTQSVRLVLRQSKVCPQHARSQQRQSGPSVDIHG
jgi:hypothetical protein